MMLRAFLLALVLLVTELSIACPGTTGAWSILFAALALPAEYVGTYLVYRMFLINFNAGYGALQAGLEQIEAAAKAGGRDQHGKTAGETRFRRRLNRLHSIIRAVKMLNHGSFFVYRFFFCEVFPLHSFPEGLCKVQHLCAGIGLPDQAEGHAPFIEADGCRRCCFLAGNNTKQPAGNDLCGLFCAAGAGD